MLSTRNGAFVLRMPSILHLCGCAGVGIALVLPLILSHRGVVRLCVPALDKLPGQAQQASISRAPPDGLLTTRHMTGLQ